MDVDRSQGEALGSDGTPSLWGQLETNGFALAENMISPAAAVAFADILDRSNITKSVRQSDVYGARNLLGIPQIGALALGLRAWIAPVLGGEAIPVRGLFFDKTAQANWPVPFHQDLTLALREKIDIAGWGPWSCKGNRIQAQAPAAILEQMLAVRIHLDACTAENGPLRVLPGTHRLGRLTRPRIDELRGLIEERRCVAPLCSALLMRPLLLHASSAAAAPWHRRVIHLEFAPKDLLPAELAWDPA